MEEVKYSQIPAELKKLPQWILWKLLWLETPQRWTKIPYQIDGHKAEADNYLTWSTFDKVVELEKDYSGIGFVFSKGYVGIDLDNAFEDGKLKDWAQKVLDNVESYTEISQSKKGLHIIIPSELKVKGVKEEWLNKNNEKEGIEFYSTTRYFVMTGNVYEDRNVLKGGQDEYLNNIYLLVEKKLYSGKHKNSQKKDDDVKTLPDVKATVINYSEAEMLEIIKSKRNGLKFSALYDYGDWKGQGYGSQSEADLALCSSLMFFFGNNANIVDSMFRKSKLYRKKWDEKRGAQSYGEQTITKAYSSQVFDWKRAKEVDNDEPADDFDVTDLEGLKAEKIEWMWPGRLAKRMITQFQGPPGQGKSQITSYITSVISTGGQYVDGYVAEQGNVLLITSEDDLAATIKPRLMAYGANMKNIKHLGMLKQGNKQSILNIGLHIEQLKRVLQKIPDIRLVVIDPISAFLGKVDANNNAEVRGLLAGLQKLINEFNCACIMITHNNKSSGTNALSRASGSVAFGAHARTAFMFGPNPLNPGEGENRNFVMMSVKNNLKSPPATLGYSIRSQFVQNPGEEMIETSRVDFHKLDETDFSAEDVADWQPEKKKKNPVGRPPERLDQCADELKVIIEQWGLTDFIPNQRYINLKRQLNSNTDNDEFSDDIIRKAMKKIGYRSNYNSEQAEEHGWYYKAGIDLSDEFKQDQF